MKIQIEINEDELREMVTERIAGEITRNIMSNRLESQDFRKAIKDAAKQAVEANLDKLMHTATVYAGDKIAREKGKILMALTEEE